MLRQESKGMVLMRFLPQGARNKGKEKQAGLSLVEVLVGISILAIGMLAVAQMQITAIQGIDQSEEATVALNLAREQMEDIINMDYAAESLPGGKLYSNNNLSNDNNLAGATITDGSGDPSEQWDELHPNLPSAFAPISTPSGDYEVFWNVAAPAGATDYKQVVVIVRWTRKGKTRIRTLSFVRGLVS
jgi:type IV pilus assembly protein PilV